MFRITEGQEEVANQGRTFKAEQASCRGGAGRGRTDPCWREIDKERRTGLCPCLYLHLLGTFCKGVRVQEDQYL